MIASPAERAAAADAAASSRAWTKSPSRHTDFECSSSSLAFSSSSAPARALERVERAARELGGVLEREPLGGVVGGHDGVLDRAHDRVRSGRGEVARERGEPGIDAVGVAHGDRVADAAVQARAARLGQAVLERRAQQRVGERVLARAPARLDQQPGLDGRVEHVEQRPLVDVDDVLEQLELEVAADQRRGAEHGLGLVGQPRDAAGDHVAQPRRDAVADARRALDGQAALGQVAGELLDEERVAVRLGADRGGLGRAVEQLGDLVLREPLEVQARQRALALEVGERLQQRMARPELVVAVGADEQHGAELRRARQRAQEKEGAAIGPVQVVDDEQQRSGPGEPPGGRDDAGEEAAAVGLGIALDRVRQVGHAVAQLRQQAREVGPVGAEDGGQVGVRDALDVTAEQLDPGPEREQLLLVAAAVEDGEAGRPRGPAPRRARSCRCRPRPRAAPARVCRLRSRAAPRAAARAGPRGRPARPRPPPPRAGRAARRARAGGAPPVRGRVRPHCAAAARAAPSARGRATRRARRAAARARPRTRAAPGRRCRVRAGPPSARRARTRGTAPPRRRRGRPARPRPTRRGRAAGRSARSPRAPRRACRRARAGIDRSRSPRAPGAARARRSRAPPAPAPSRRARRCGRSPRVRSRRRRARPPSRSRRRRAGRAAARCGRRCGRARAPCAVATAAATAARRSRRDRRARAPRSARRGARDGPGSAPGRRTAAVPGGRAAHPRGARRPIPPPAVRRAGSESLSPLGRVCTRIGSCATPAAIRTQGGCKALQRRCS